MSPNSQKGSKFSDSDPGPSSPLQRCTIRTPSIGSNDSNKAAKPSRLNSGNHSAGNRLIQSVPSLTKLKKENSDATHEKKVSMARIRRLSEPKMSISNHASSTKKRSTEPPLKAKVPNETESKKKISAILNLDKSKAATLPELKIRTPKGPGATIGNSKAQETMQSVNYPSVSEGASASMERITAKVSHHSELDDNPVVEKTVVMLEYQKPSIRTGPASEDNLNPQIEVSSGNREPSEHQSQSQLSSHEVCLTATSDVENLSENSVMLRGS